MSPVTETACYKSLNRQQTKRKGFVPPSDGWAAKTSPVNPVWVCETKTQSTGIKCRDAKRCSCSSSAQVWRYRGLCILADVVIHGGIILGHAVVLLSSLL